MATGWRLGVEEVGEFLSRGEEVGLEATDAQLLEDVVGGGGVGDVGVHRHPVSAGEHATESTLGVDDQSPRVSTRGERARLGSAGEHGYLARQNTRFAIEVGPNEGADGIEAADSEARGVPILENHQGRVLVLV